MRAESAVEPTRSVNITVTWRRSAVSRGFGSVDQRGFATAAVRNNSHKAAVLKCRPDRHGGGWLRSGNQVGGNVTVQPRPLHCYRRGYGDHTGTGTRSQIEEAPAARAAAGPGRSQ